MGNLEALANMLRSSAGLSAKRDIASVASRLEVSGASSVPVGDDCAAIEDGEGFTLFAIEGFMNQFVTVDPWFAGWCGVMVNVSDVAAMGGRAVAVVDAIWANGVREADPVLAGLHAAATAFGIPIVGGHTNLKTDRAQLSVAILGKAKRLLTSFDATPGDRLIAAIDLRGRYREQFLNWEAATTAPHGRLRGDYELLPIIAESGLCKSAKDISQGSVVGTAAMLADCSGVGVSIDIRAIPKPDGVACERWLSTFPSFGFLLSVAPAHVSEVIEKFHRRGIAAGDIGLVTADRRVTITDGVSSETVCDLSIGSLLGCGQRGAAA
ncbi:MAG: sll0787 family AIR synthase-like protein [Xanthobacteraceae bacterium]|nr:sll0787 family AIR synthase-like protein [Xanthobacteraceae bacterium]